MWMSGEPEYFPARCRTTYIIIHHGNDGLKGVNSFLKGGKPCVGLTIKSLLVLSGWNLVMGSYISILTGSEGALSAGCSGDTEGGR